MKLTKIKLINWHLFSNTTINVNGNFLITGENGCGKSTLTDAIYFVLSGGDEKNFNNAANANAKRTLTTYIRGKLGNEGDGKEFLRNDSDVICHIALEYAEENTNHTMVLGCVLEIIDSAKPKIKFYVIQNYKIDDSDYINENKILDYKQLKNKLNAKKVSFSDSGLNSTIRERKETIGRDIFKLDNKDKYIELLKSAIAFKPIDEVSSFVDKFLLKENNIEIDSLMEEIRGYRNTKKILDKENEKLQCLESFIDKAKRYEHNAKKLIYFDALDSQVKIEEINSEIKRYENDLLKINANLEDYKREKTSKDEDINNCNRELIELENNQSYNALKAKKEKFSNICDEYKNKNQQMNHINEILKNEKKLAKKFNLKENFYDDIKNDNFPLFKQHIGEYFKDLESLKEDKNNNKYSLKTKIESIDEEINKKCKELDDIKSGKNTYNDNTTKLLKLLKEELKENYHRDIEIKPLCEYLEIKDERWTDAVEGYLNTQRFDIIIDPKYYDDAVEIYEKYKFQYNIHSVGIVRCEKHFRTESAGNTLFDKLEIHNKFAMFAAYMLLGKVVCVDNVSELKDNNISITDTCMTYKNYTVRNINPKVYAVPFIGKNSILKRQSILESEIKDLSDEHKKNENDLNKLLEDLRLLKMSKVEKLKETDNIWRIVDELNEKIKQLKAEIEEDEKNRGLLEISEKIDRIENKLLGLRYLNSELEKNIEKLNIDKGIKEKSLIIKSKDLKEYKDKYNFQIEKFDKIDYENFANNYLKNNIYVKSQIYEDTERIRNSNNSTKQFIIEGMRKYVSNYASEMFADIENIKDFIRTYNQLKDRDIIEFRDKANTAFERCQQSFKADFVSKIADRIESAKNELKKINKKLKDTPFGADEEVYEFTFSASDDDEMKEYYKLITSGKVMQVNTLLDEAFDERDQDTMKRLFDNIIIESDDSESERKLQRYLDYRQYMKYDIKTTNKYGDTSLFSKTNREKSGGETQTPFYVIIASCFDRLIKKGGTQSSTCTVIFDEAFNNMDEGRINSLMEFYKKLNIQLAIVVPTNRMATLANYMDTVVGLIKIKNRIEIITGE